MASLTADQIQFLSTFLSNLNDGSADWQEIAQQRGIARKDNAATAFKNLVKKIGLQYDSKKFTHIEGFEFADAATKMKAASPRKRKVNDKNTNDAKDDKSPTKKKRTAKAIKEAEEEDGVSEKDIGNTENGVKTEVKDEADAMDSSDE